MRCLKCGYESPDIQGFIVDYVWSESEDDEIPVYQCPKCKNDDDDSLVDMDE